MYTKWTQHLRLQADQDNFEKKIYNAKDVLERLKTLLEEKERSFDIAEYSVEDFSSPNWSEKQAFRNGNRAALHYVKTLLDLNKTDQSQ